MSQPSTSINILWRGTPTQILDLAANQQIQVFASEPLLAELRDVLSRPKLQPRLQALQVTVDDLLAVVIDLVELCSLQTVNVPQLRDPDDLIILATALAANADAIVTGDRDLLTLSEVESIPILTPMEWLSRYFPS
ncbi:MAG TPA: putative toxin-antitoxin system toxin component, PIN family [Allocoleopsis sp.]